MNATLVSKTLCVLCVIVPSFVSASDIEYRDAPMLENRKAVPPSTRQRYSDSFPPLDSLTVKYLIRLGISRTLRDDQIEYFRRRGTHPRVLYETITEFGITPEENTRLARAGVTFALQQWFFDSFHWVALSDTIVEGTVSRLTGHLGGIYHTEVLIDVERVHKNCSATPSRGPRKFWLLHTGPYEHRGHVDHRAGYGEPKLRLGERVLIMAGRTPERLRAMVGDALAHETLESLEHDFGPPRQLLRRASRGKPGLLEIYRAYKVVRNRFVLKGSGFRVEDPTDKMDRAHFANRVGAIYKAQKHECHARVDRVENR